MANTHVRCGCANRRLVELDGLRLDGELLWRRLKWRVRDLLAGWVHHAASARGSRGCACIHEHEGRRGVDENRRRRWYRIFALGLDKSRLQRYDVIAQLVVFTLDLLVAFLHRSEVPDLLLEFLDVSLLTLPKSPLSGSVLSCAFRRGQFSFPSSARFRLLGLLGT